MVAAGGALDSTEVDGATVEVTLGVAAGATADVVGAAGAGAADSDPAGAGCTAATVVVVGLAESVTEGEAAKASIASAISSAVGFADESTGLPSCACLAR